MESGNLPGFDRSFGGGFGVVLGWFWGGFGVVLGWFRSQLGGTSAPQLVVDTPRLVPLGAEHLMGFENTPDWHTAKMVCGSTLRDKAIKENCSAGSGHSKPTRVSASVQCFLCPFSVNLSGTLSFTQQTLSEILTQRMQTESQLGRPMPGRAPSALPRP